MYPDAPCYAAWEITTQNWPLSSPDGTRAPPHTACTTMEHTRIQASSGIDQGCPLSPCGFAAAVDPISRAILTETRSKLDDGAKLWAYLDDWYIWIKPQHIPAAIELASSATRTINLELQPTKIQIWIASCESPFPPAFQDKAKSTLKCLGAHLRIAGDSEGCPVELGGKTAIQRFRSISATLRELNQAGLKMQTVNDLLTVYVGAASQHALRTTFVPFEEAVSFDKEIVSYWSQLAGRDVTSPLFHLPLRMGAPGVGSAAHRHAAPPWTAWHSIIPTLMEATESQTSTPYSPPHPSYGANFTNYKLRYHNKWTHPHSFSNHWVRPSEYTGPKRLWSTRYNKRHTNSFLQVSQRTPSRKPSSDPKQPKTREHTYNNPTAKPTRRTTDASKSLSPDDSCCPTQPLATLPISHPHAQR